MCLTHRVVSVKGWIGTHESYCPVLRYFTPALATWDVLQNANSISPVVHELVGEGAVEN